MNVLGETPFDVGSVARQHNKAKSGKKLQSFYFQPGDAIVFSDRQFHRTGRPSTFPSPDNMRIHFLCANNAKDASGRYMLVFPTRSPLEEYAQQAGTIQSRASKHGIYFA